MYACHRATWQRLSALGKNSGAQAMPMTQTWEICVRRKGLQIVWACISRYMLQLDRAFKPAGIGVPGAARGVYVGFFRAQEEEVHGGGGKAPVPDSQRELH